MSDKFFLDDSKQIKSDHNQDTNDQEGQKGGQQGSMDKNRSSSLDQTGSEPKKDTDLSYSS